MKDSRPEGRLTTRYQVVILGRKSWTTSVSRCQSWEIKVAGGFGTGGWDEPVTPSGMQPGGHNGSAIEYYASHAVGIVGRQRRGCRCRRAKGLVEQAVCGASVGISVLHTLYLDIP